ncbi:NUDIX domain-containing protein [Phaeobacter inhibens]|uniref:NUDIX hydrolase n=1 Tax=Phaeobacter inhibens TaxID=221822 RepID=UPI0001632927|nr:NUDIX hydrolase [Phaeobacter inhibens]AFO93123.1 putative NUDIX hydrolase [Phaeobacter inhibens DSM 17395]AUQ47825.1 putative NUDIX hydrolase [Phaeobacter inhibens]AXT24402.1 NUDIX domain-containing protein [Phaeobacter inhibens]
MIRRFGDTPEKSQSYRRRPGVYALLPRDGELLLTCQREPGPDIQLPGGGIDPGESPIPALHREVMEETGWTISQPRKLGTFRRFAYMPEYDLWAEKLCHIYIARPARQVCPPTEPLHDAVWMRADVACEILGNAGDRHFASIIARLMGQS